MIEAGPFGVDIHMLASAQAVQPQQVFPAPPSQLYRTVEDSEIRGGKDLSQGLEPHVQYQFVVAVSLWYLWPTDLVPVVMVLSPQWEENQYKSPLARLPNCPLSMFYLCLFPMWIS